MTGVGGITGAVGGVVFCSSDIFDFCWFELPIQVFVR